MDKIVDAILKLQPFGAIFKKLGCSDDWSALFSVLLITGLVWLFVAIFKDLHKRYKEQKQSIEDIKPQFDHLSIKKAKKYYIQTQYQNASPSRQEEPGFTHKYIARNKLIPFFIKTAFNERVDSERFYLILADSGMGKTTFMVNLYLAYHSFFCYSRKDKMKLFRFSNPDTIEQIESIKTEDARGTILLLDALDEDPGIISTDPQVTDAEAFQNRIDEIIDLTKNFREVIITCRTQYFPGQEEDPYELKIKRPDERGFYILNKLYISPFNEKEVSNYLNKKFGVIPFINQKKKRRALFIVSQSKNLVMRPMLLSYIDYLIEDEVAEVTTLSIYDILVAKWIQREADKRKGLADRKSFIKKLRDLSSKTAIAIYTNWRKEGRMYLTKEEALWIAEKAAIQLKPEEITGQSLLTCDGAGNWKFAHKSILEFFLAKETWQNPRFLIEMDFKGMDMAKKFYEELRPRIISFEKPGAYIDDSGKAIGKGSPDHYIYKSPMYEAEFDEIMLGEKFYDTLSRWQKCRFKDAIAFCNKMNIKHGYPYVYDGEGGILQNESNPSGNIDGIRGFRLPTEKELFFLNDIPQNKVEIYNSAKAVTKLTKTVSKLTSKPGKEDYQFPKIAHEEWCYDGVEVTVVNLLLSLLKGEDYFTSTNSIKINIEAILGEQSSHLEFCFRLMFIP